LSKPIVFISYSHKDEKWKNQLVSHLGVLNQIEVWEDRRIGAGRDWESEINTTLESAGAAILLISRNFLTSNFILTNEVPALLQRRIREGLPVIPIIVSACAWEQVDWLAPIQCRPKDGTIYSLNGDKREAAWA
jgi:hypothetical protein